MSFNKVVILGRLGKDPEVSFAKSGTAVCNLSVATSERFTRDGEKKERTDWHRVKIFGKQAEAAGQFLKKGQEVLIEGKIQYSESEKDGVKKYFTDIIADRFVFIGSKAKDNSEEAF